jgi:hypothetical protein
MPRLRARGFPAGVRDRGSEGLVTDRILRLSVQLVKTE